MRDDHFDTKQRRNVVVELKDLFDREVPRAIEAEMALLGAMIIAPDCIGDVHNILHDSFDFFDPRHQLIYKIITQLYDRHHNVDLVELLNEFRSNEALDTIGGFAYLEQLAQETPGSAGAMRWAQIVRDKSKLRKLIKVAGETVFNAYNVSHTDAVSEVLDKAEADLFKISEEEDKSKTRLLDEQIEIEIREIQAIREHGATIGVRTHYYDLDAKTNGLQAGDMIVLAARPSMGKTALALNILEQIAVGTGQPKSRPQDFAHTPVGLFSLEMSRSAIARRLLSALSGVSTSKMLSGKCSDKDMIDLEDCLEDLRVAQAKILIDDSPSLTVMSLRTKARRMVLQHNVKLLIVDYLQLMTAPHASKESRQVEVSAISRGVKSLARELDIPVICLSQLNRGPEGRHDNRPRMSDLRESGSIEQDADVVMLLHRESYYHIGDKEWASTNYDRVNSAELIIAKQRNGPTGVVELVWDPDTTRFRNADPAHRAQSPHGYNDTSADQWTEQIGRAPISVHNQRFGPTAGTVRGPEAGQIAEPPPPPTYEEEDDDTAGGVPF